MKTIIKLCIALLLTSNQLFAYHKTMLKDKDVDGIFMNVNDYKKGNLTCHINKHNKCDKIKLNQFFTSPDIVCTEHDKESVYLKDSIFAIHLFNNESYRFINLSPCFIADTSFLFIYEFETTKKEYVMSGPHRREKDIPVTYYYFSFGNHNKVYLLTLENLHKYFFAEPNVYGTFNKNFTSNEMLQETDKQTGRFLLNVYLISEAKK
jgi:hypothetical protein